MALWLSSLEAVMMSAGCFPSQQVCGLPLQPHEDSIQESHCRNPPKLQKPHHWHHSQMEHPFSSCSCTTHCRSILCINSEGETMCKLKGDLNPGPKVQFQLST